MQPECKAIKDCAQDFFSYLVAALTSMIAVHQNFRLNNGDKAPD